MLHAIDFNTFDVFKTSGNAFWSTEYADIEYTWKTEDLRNKFIQLDKTTNDEEWINFKPGYRFHPLGFRRKPHCSWYRKTVEDTQSVLTIPCICKLRQRS